MHQVSPPLSTRRLARVRYQLDLEFLQAGIVGRGHQQEDPAFESPCKCAYTDAILPNALTLLQADLRRMPSDSQSRGPQQRSAVRRSIVSLRASERPREASWALAGRDTQVDSETCDERKERASERSRASQCNIIVAIRYRCVELGVVLNVGWLD